MHLRATAYMVYLIDGDLRKDGRRIPLSGLWRGRVHGSLRIVQRLFSIFPSGAPGAGLLLLRLGIAAALLVDGAPYWSLGRSVWLLVACAAAALLLCIGLLTPYVAGFACLVELILLATAGRERENVHLLTALDSAAASLLGPGAFSLDARIFGRRLLNVSAD